MLKNAIFFRWVCDNEPDCGSAPSGKLDESDEDPARCRGNVTCDGNNFLCKVRFDNLTTAWVRHGRGQVPEHIRT